jgi:hypothetical protein
MKYRVHHPPGSPQIIEADSYELVDGWHRFETYQVNRLEPYYKHFSDDIKVEVVDGSTDHTR